VLKVEHCVVCPPANVEASKVRVVQTVALGREAWLRGVNVFSEQWYGPWESTTTAAAVRFSNLRIGD
jgi:hypothetical protein